MPKLSQLKGTQPTQPAQTTQTTQTAQKSTKIQKTPTGGTLSQGKLSPIQGKTVNTTANRQVSTGVVGGSSNAAARQGPIGKGINASVAGTTTPVVANPVTSNPQPMIGQHQQTIQASQDFAKQREQQIARDNKTQTLLGDTSGMSVTDLYLGASNRTGGSVNKMQKEPGTRNWNASLSSTYNRITEMYNNEVAPALEAYNKAMTDYYAGRLDLDSAMEAYNNYVSKQVQYSPLQQAFEAVRHSNGAGISDQSSYEDIMKAADLWDATMAASENTLAQMSAELDQLRQDYDSAVATFTKDQTQANADKVNALVSQIQQKSGEFQAAAFVYQEMANNYSSIDGMAESALRREQPQIFWLQNVGRVDAAGNVVLTASYDDVSNRIHTLENKAEQIADPKEREEYLREAKWYQGLLSSGQIFEHMDGTELAQNLDVQQGRVDEANNTLRRLQWDMDELAYLGQVETDEYKALEAAYKAAEEERADAQTQVSAINRFIDQGAHEEVIRGLSRETQQNIDKFINLSAAYGDMSQYIRGTLPADYQLNVEMSAPELVKLTETLRKDLAEEGLSADEVQSMLLYATREANAERIDNLKQATIGKAEDSGWFLNWLTATGNSLASGLGYLDLAWQGLENYNDAWTGKSTVDYNTDAQDFYHRQTAYAEEQFNRYYNRMLSQNNNDQEIAQQKAQARMNWYNLSMSMGQSTAIAALSMMGVPGALLLLSGSAATQTAQDMHERGYSDGAALVAGAISGISEYVTEKIALDSLLKGFTRAAGKGLTAAQIFQESMINLGVQGLTEGAEEGLSDIFNRFGDELVYRYLNGGVSEIEMKARQLQIQGDLSWDEAKKAAEKDWVKTFAEDVWNGFLSGVMMGAGSTAIGGAVSAAQDAATGARVENLGLVDEVLALAGSIDQATADMAGMKARDSIAWKSTLGTWYQLGHAVNNFADAYNVDAINSRLRALGEEEISPDLIRAIDSAANGYRLLPLEKQALQESQYGQQVLDELQKYRSAEEDYFKKARANNDYSADSYREFLQSFDGADNSWAAEASRVGRGVSEEFYDPTTGVDYADATDLARQVETGKARLQGDDAAIVIQRLLRSGVASLNELTGILQSKELRAAYEEQTGQTLPKKATEARRAMREHLASPDATAEEKQAVRTRNMNPDSTVLGSGATALSKAGLTDVIKAQTYGEILDAIANGEDISPFDLRKLDLNNAAVRQVFGDRTGMTNLPKTVNYGLKKALVDRVVGEVQQTRANQEALAEGAEQLLEAQQDQAQTQLAQEIKEATRGKVRRTAKENRAARTENMKNAFEERKAAAGRYRRLDVKGRSELEVLQQIRQQAGDYNLMGKSAFEDLYRDMNELGTAELTKGQQMELDNRYNNYMLIHNLTVQERTALNNAYSQAAFGAQNGVGEVNVDERHPVRRQENQMKRGEGKVVFEPSINRDSLTEVQSTSVKILERLAKALGVTFHMYQTEEVEGARVWTDAEGVKHSDNGWFNPETNEIWLDINAGNMGQGTILFTASHELTHFIREWSAEKYNKLANFLVKQYGERGVSVQALVRRKQAMYAKQGINLSSDGTLEEVVADSMEAMLSDGNVLEAIEDLRSVDAETANAVVRYLKNLVDKVREVFAKFKPDSLEGQTVAKWGKDFEQLQQLFTEGLQTAGENFREGGVKISEETAKDLESIGSTVVDDVVVSQDLADLMKTDGFEKPQDPLSMHSVRTMPGWKETYKEGGSKDVVEAMDTFVGAIMADDALMSYLPTGAYAYNKKGFGPLRKNVEYVRTFDMDASCPRTFQFVNYRNALQRIAGRPLTDGEAMNLMFLMRRMNQQIPCTYCYVENKRILKNASYLNYFQFRANVMSAATEEEALTKMYSYNADKGTISDAARKVFDQWRGEVKNGTAFYPTAKECWTSFQTAKNSVWNWLDQQLAEGSIQYGDGVKKPTSTKKLNDLVNEHFSVTDKSAQREIEGFIQKWQYDTLAGNAHVYDITNDPAVSEVDQDMLSLHRTASNYAASVSQARLVDDYVPYTDELKNIDPKDKAYIIGMGGIRKHSSNDFRMDYVVDYLQFYADLAKGGWTGHTYTKSVDFCKIFGRSGDRINLSIAMNTENGKITENQQEGAAWKDARELRNAYPDLGTMAMVTDNAQLSFALNSDWIDMIIPFHASGLPKAVWYNVRAWSDYTSVQLESFYTLDDMKQKLTTAGVDFSGLGKEQVEDLFNKTFDVPVVINEKGNRVKPHFFPGDTVVYDPEGKKQIIPGHHNDVQRYFELCEQYGVHPRFKGVRVTDANGNVIDVTEHPNYLKLIKETSRTDTEQKPIQFNFDKYDAFLGMSPMEYAMQRLQEEASIGGYANTAEDPWGIVHMFEELYLDKNRDIGWLPSENDNSQAAQELRVAMEYTADAYKEMYDADLQTLDEVQKATGDNVMHSVRGVNARNADREALARAEQMERDGVNWNEIRRETGWYRGADGMWRSEIDDSGARYFRDGAARFSEENPEYEEYQKLINAFALEDNELDRLDVLQKKLRPEMDRLKRMVDSGDATLDMILRHDELFAAYPELRDVRVEFQRMKQGETGYYDADNKLIAVNQKYRSNPMEPLIHEIQHAIQDIEGFSGGTSMDYYRGLGYSGAEAQRRYTNASGEIEARDMAARRNMTAEQRRNTPPQNAGEDSGIRYSLRSVDPVQPTSTSWSRTKTFDEVKRDHPTLFALDTDDLDVRNPTQIRSTVSTYRKVYDILKREGFKGNILDASSGLGYGTKAGIEEYGFNVDDIEPYPDKSYNPKYTDYSTLNNQYDVIISNAVLNVLPQDLRDDLTVKMGELLAPGGRLFVNVRGNDVDTLDNGKNTKLGTREWFVESTGSYQKGFTKPELVAYLQDALGPGFTVTPTSQFGGVAAIVTKTSNTMFSVRETQNAVRTAEEAAALIDKEMGKGTAKQIKQTLRYLERRAQRAEKAAEIAREKLAARDLQHKDTLRRKKATISLLQKQTGLQINELNRQKRELSNKLNLLSKDHHQLVKAVDDMKIDTEWAVKMAQSDGEQKVKELQRYYKDKLKYNEKTDRQWARGLYQSTVRETKKADKKALREAVRIERMVKSLPAQQGAAIRRKYENRAAQVLINNNSDIAAPMPFDGNESVAKKSAQFRTAVADAMGGFYRAMVNATQRLDSMAKLQTRQDNISVMINVVRASKSTADRFFTIGMLDKAGNIIGPSLKETLLWHDENGKFDQTMQDTLSTYMFHLHNIDRMTLKEKAINRVEAFKQQYPWLADLTNRELQRLIAEKNPIAQEYVRLMKWANTVEDKAVFGWGDEENTPVQAAVSQMYVDEVQSKMPEVVEKANQIYDWWDVFMREWAVGTSISEAQYEYMREIYPHYVPTFREFGDNKNRMLGPVVSNNGITPGVVTKEAKGSTRELLRMEDQYVRSLQQIIRMSRQNDLMRNIIEEFLFDDEGTFAQYGYFDWESASRATMENFWEFAKEQNRSSTEKTKDNMYKISCWVDGEKMSAYVDRAMFEGIQFLFDKSPDWVKSLTRAGNKLTGPMKSMITGLNPFFALKNIVRDQHTAFVNSVAGVAFPKYLAQAAAKMATSDNDWINFQNLGGVAGSMHSMEGGFSTAMDTSLNQIRSLHGWKKVKQAKDTAMGAVENILGTPGELSESVTRFAEYLATLDMRGGDSYENRMEAIRNAAEVTVDFGRRGSLGTLINAWVPYWNPSVQGLDKAIRNVFGEPTVAKKLGKIGRAVLVNILPTALTMALIGAGDKWDEYEELSDQVKDNYYCIPLPGEHKFLKLPKSQDWAAFISTPFMRMMEGVNGRDDPWENFFESALLPMMPFDVRSLPGLGLEVPMILPLPLQMMFDLADNKNYAGSAIIPYNLLDASAKEQWDADTSWLAQQFGKVFKASPKAVDYIIDNYFGNFFGTILSAIPYSPLSPVGYYTGEVDRMDRINEGLQTILSPFVADNRYSNSTRSAYYEMLNTLRQRYTDTGIHGDPKEMEDYEFYQALTMTNGYADQISAMSKMARELGPGEEKDMLYLAMSGLASEALDFYNAYKSGEVDDPVHWMTYHRYGDRILEETAKLKKYEDDFNFSGMLGNPTTVYDRSGDNDIKFKLDDDLVGYYADLRANQYQTVLDQVISSSQYREADNTQKAALLEEGKRRALKLAEQDMLNYLQRNGIRGETITKADYTYEEKQAAYSISQILGDDDAYSRLITDTLIRLYDYGENYSFNPVESKRQTFNSQTNDSRVYVLSKDQQAKYSEIYHDTFSDYYTKVINSGEFKAASDEEQAVMLARARNYVTDEVNDRFNTWLEQTGAVSQEKEKASEVMSLDAKYAVQRALGMDESYSMVLTDELIRLYDNKAVGSQSYLPPSYRPTSYTVYDNRGKKTGYKWILDSDQKDMYEAIAHDIYQKDMLAVINSREYSRLDDYGKAQLLCATRDQVTEKAKDAFIAWLRQTNAPMTYTKSAEELARQQDIKYAEAIVDSILGN